MYQEGTIKISQKAFISFPPGPSMFSGSHLFEALSDVWNGFHAHGAYYFTVFYGSLVAEKKKIVSSLHQWSRLIESTCRYLFLFRTSLCLVKVQNIRH